MLMFGLRIWGWILINSQVEIWYWSCCKSFVSDRCSSWRNYRLSPLCILAKYLLRWEKLVCSKFIENILCEFLLRQLPGNIEDVCRLKFQTEKWETWLNICFLSLCRNVAIWFPQFCKRSTKIRLAQIFRFLADISLFVPENDSNHFSSEQQNQRACQFWYSHNFLLN